MQVTIQGPPTLELAERVQKVLELERWHRERRAARDDPRGYWAAKVQEADQALDALFQLRDRALELESRFMAGR